MARQADSDLGKWIWQFAKSGDVGGVVDFFSGKSESERRVLLPVTKELKGEISRLEKGESTAGKQNGNRASLLSLDKLRAVCAACEVATGSKAELSKFFGWEFGHNDGLLTKALVDRNPTWLGEFIDEALERGGHGRQFWFALARQLFEAGLISKPACDGYTLGMIDWVYWSWGKHGKTIEAVFEQRPDLLDDIWRLFEVEGGGETSLANAEKYLKGGEGLSWTRALKQLSDDGVLDRGRLLDESLKTLARDFAQYRVGWFSRFHEAMEPTVDERAARVEAYCALLSSNIAPTVSFALKALEQVQKAKRLSPQPFTDSVAPVLRAEQKGTVLAAIRMLEEFAQASKTQLAALEHAATALEHPASEVQSKVLNLYRKFGVPAGVDLGEYRDMLAAPVREKFADILGKSPAAPPEPDLDDGQLIATAKALPPEWAACAGIPEVLSALVHGSPLPALRIDPVATPRLDPSKRCKPILDLDELIECASRVMEDPADPDEIERLIDGVCRLCDQRPPDFEQRTAQLAKRAKLRSETGWGGFQERFDFSDIGTLLLSWITRVKHAFRKDINTFVPLNGAGTTILRPRLEEFAPRVRQGQAFQPLSAPTHAGGWIDPISLAERAGQGDARLPEDAVVAMLRLAPDNRAAAAKALKGLAGEVASALRYALSGDAPKREMTDFALWHAASLARTMGQGDDAIARRFEQFSAFFKQPDWNYHVLVQRRDKYTFRYLILNSDWGKGSDKNARLGTTCSVTLIKGQFPASFSPYADTLRWMATHFLVYPEVFFAVGAARLGNNLDWSEAEWQNRAYLEPLLDADCPIGPMATLCLTAGLAAKEPGEHGLATDVLIRAIEDGRIDGEIMGSTMGSLLFTGLIKPPRWAKTLGDAARTSPLHEQVVRLAIERTLADAGKAEPPSGLNTLLELLHELCVEANTAITNSAARQFLAGIKGGTKLAKVAKELTGLSSGQPSRHADQAASIALKSRIDRASRWAATAGKTKGK